jgi:hypothetical protein
MRAPRNSDRLIRAGRRQRALALLGVSALAAMGVAACGGSKSGSGSSSTASRGTTSGSADGVQIMRSAYTRALGERTAKFTVRTTVHAVSTAGSTESQTVTGVGETNFQAHDFEMSINAPSGGTVEVLQIGTTAYIRVPVTQRSQVPGGKPWVSVNLNQVDEAKLGRSFSQLASANNDKPSRVLASLAQVSDRVVKVGTATIKGTRTTEYQAKVDLNKLAARAKAKAGAKAGQAVHEQAQALGTGTFPAKIWIGPGSLVRQATLKVPIPAASTGATNGQGNATLTMDFFSYGTQVHLTAPRAGRWPTSPPRSSNRPKPPPTDPGWVNGSSAEPPSFPRKFSGHRSSGYPRCSCASPCWG